MKIESADFVVSNIFLDNGCEPFYGVGYAFPKKFATVNIQLSTTDAMTEVVDAIRKEKGFLPMLPTEKHQTDYDMDGWYDFYLDINDYDVLRVSDHIDAVVDNGNGEDDFTCYTIELSDAVRAVLYKHLNEQAKRVCGMSLDEMLVEAHSFID